MTLAPADETMITEVDDEIVTPRSPERSREVPDTRVGRWWTLSILVSAALLLVLQLLWFAHDRRDVTTHQLVDDTEVDAALESAMGRGGADSALRLRTGVFIQSLVFRNTNDVHLTGYLWHRFPGDVRNAVGDGSSSNRVPVVQPDGDLVFVTPGFILPEQVDSSFPIELRSVIYNEPRTEPAPQPVGDVDDGSLPDDREPERPAVTDPPPPEPGPDDGSDDQRDDERDEGNRTTSTMPPTLFRSVPAAPGRSVDDPRRGGTTTVLYYFEAPVRQPFEYADFPFDHKVVWLRVWPADFEQNIVLVPDFDSYPCQQQPTQNCTGVNDTFGVDNSIELGEFDREDTYFDYHLDPFYTSNLGNDRFQQSDYPELRFNVVIRRSVQNALVANLVPLFVAAGLAFGVLVTLSRDRRRAQRFGFSTTQVMTTLAGLFLAVLIAHQQLRGSFEGVVYLEYFYFLMYLVLLGVAVVAILVSAPATRDRPILAFGDALLPKVLYWPSMLFAAVVITLVAI